MKWLALMTLAIVSAGCSSSVTERYASLDDARKAGLFERDWLPDALPSSTREIKVSNDLDLNISAGEFTLALDDLDSFTAQLRPYAAARADGDEHLESYLQAKEKEGLRVGALKRTSSVWIFVCDPKTARCTYQLVPSR